MNSLSPLRRIVFIMAVFASATWPLFGVAEGVEQCEPLQAESLTADQTALLDVPLLFVKRHSYTGIHIYDTYYKWPPGGGGIYILENPSAPQAERKIRPVIDATTLDTLGNGVYSHPELSWDAQKLLFCFKSEPQGNTSIYEIGVNGQGLQRLTDPGPTCVSYKGSQHGQHDIAPAYLPDNRVVFLSTRTSGLVPCNNTGVAILHVMNSDGSDIHPISVNYVNEFDPAILPDGRILFGRWEYVDKNALTIQSLWTMNPDGTQESALFANNLVFPEAVLDTRPVPGSSLVVGTFARHNGPPRGSIAFIDPRLGKNNPKGISNLERPGEPTYDLGDSCEPWPLSENAVLFSGRPSGAKRNVIEIIDRSGDRTVLLTDSEICLHSPMLVKPRQVPPVLPSDVDREAQSGRFFVQDVYQGLEGVKRGDVKWLRVVEETSRVSASTMGGSPYNQTFLVSAALAFSTKTFLGIVPVAKDGSAYFEVPSGRALYLQALDADLRLIQSMRTFVQAAPGTTRSCVGCHEHKDKAPTFESKTLNNLARAPDRLQPESWGSGYLDYPSMVQPILDRHCAKCHGGREGIAAGLDLSGGWTEHFNISYENLVSRRESQLVAHWISGIDCMNGTAFWSSQIFPPRGHGSGAAPLADLLMEGHDGHIPNLTPSERDLLMAWMDSNGLYHGTWDSTSSGCAIKGWKAMRESLIEEMREGGCLSCHDNGGKSPIFEEDWVNLKDPEMSRILRAPMVAGAGGLGLGSCRERTVSPRPPRVRQLVNGYAHAVQPVDAFDRQKIVSVDRSGKPIASFASSENPHYQAMLAIIKSARNTALSNPRVDMPGARIVPGQSRQLVPLTLPKKLPKFRAEIVGDRGVWLSWDRRADLSGLVFELHRSDRADFEPDEKTHITSLTRLDYLDPEPPDGESHYALVLNADEQRSEPIRRVVSRSKRSSPKSGRVDVITEDVNRFTKLLSHASPARRVEGVQGLSHLKHWPAEERIMRLLDDASAQVRREAVGALCRLGTARSVPRLIGLLDDSSWEIRQKVWLGLCQMTAQNFPASAKHEWERWWNGSSLEKKQRVLFASVGGRSTHSSTYSGFAGSSLITRRAALRALRHLGECSTEESLITLLSQLQRPPLDRTERVYLCEALERIGTRRSVPVLAAHKTDAAAWALGRIGGVESEKALLGFRKTLSVLLALDRLHSTNAGPIIPQLVGNMGLITYRSQPDDVMNDQAQPIQRVSASLIRRSGRAPELIEQVLTELEYSSVQAPAVPRPPFPADWKKMLEGMRSELKPGFVREDGTTTSQPITALAHLVDDPVLVARLLPLLRHPAVVPRVYVAFALAQLKAEEAVSEIERIIREGYAFSDATALASGKHFAKSQTVRWRGFLCMALGRLGGDEARDILESLASDPEQPRDIRYSSVVGLRFIGSAESVPVLRQVVQEDIIWMVRDEARRTIEGI